MERNDKKIGEPITMVFAYKAGTFTSTPPLTSEEIREQYNGMCVRERYSNRRNSFLACFKSFIHCALHPPEEFGFAESERNIPLQISDEDLPSWMRYVTQVTGWKYVLGGRRPSFPKELSAKI